jgi:hypothetical protein
MIAVRNRLVDAYKEVTNLQVWVLLFEALIKVWR